MPSIVACQLAQLGQRLLRAEAFRIGGRVVVSASVATYGRIDK
jgi:hypothetical protein